MSRDHTIQRAPHDRQNPYVMISRNLIRDERLSPECRWLLIYLLSMEGYWILKVSQIYSHIKSHMGQKKVYKLIQEAMTFGYIKREYKVVDNLRRGVKYYVYETPYDEEDTENSTEMAVSAKPGFPEMAVFGMSKTAEHKKEHILKNKYISSSYSSLKEKPETVPKKKEEEEKKCKEINGDGPYTKEEEKYYQEALERRAKHTQDPVRCVLRHKKSIIIEKRTLDSAQSKIEENIGKRIEMSKKLVEECKYFPERFVGKITINDLGILYCGERDTYRVPLSPKEDIEVWNKVVQSWRIKEQDDDKFREF